MPSTAQANAVITNTSGATRFFGYIPPHGATLANSGTATVPGNIYARQRSLRALQALIADAGAGVITIDQGTGDVS